MGKIIAHHLPTYLHCSFPNKSHHTNKQFAGILGHSNIAFSTSNLTALIKCFESSWSKHLIQIHVVSNFFGNCMYDAHPRRICFQAADSLQAPKPLNSIPYKHAIQIYFVRTSQVPQTLLYIFLEIVCMLLTQEEYAFMLQTLYKPSNHSIQFLINMLFRYIL